jgi:hypothetical protein
MHPGDGDSILQPHEFGQHLRALDHRNMLGVCRHDLGIVTLYRGAGHHDLRAGNVLSAMAFKNDGAFFRQPLRNT